MFAVDDEGSSSDPCSLLYRGPEAFSEPETRHMRDFLLAWTNIKIAVNLHAYGNLFIVPFNFDSAENPQLASDFPKALKFYNNTHERAGFPAGNTMGNGQVGVKYPANGEASDYMLKELGIYAMSPELGTKHEFSKGFYMDNFDHVTDICEANFPWLFYTMKQLHSSLHITVLELEKGHAEVREIKLAVENQGLQEMEESTITLKLNMTLFKKVAV
jgi:hypothetical protein